MAVPLTLRVLLALVTLKDANPGAIGGSHLFVGTVGALEVLGLKDVSHGHILEEEFQVGKDRSELEMTKPFSEVKTRVGLQGSARKGNAFKTGDIATAKIEVGMTLAQGQPVWEKGLDLRRTSKISASKLHSLSSLQVL